MQITVSALKEKPSLLQEYVLRESLRRAGCPLKDISRRHIADIKKLAGGQSGRQTMLPGGWQAVRSFDKLLLKKADEKGQELPFSVHAEVPGSCETPEGTFEFRIFSNENKNIFQNTYTKRLDCDRIGNNLFIRTRRPGDYIVINRQGGKKKLKEYLIEEKIPAGQRNHILLLAQGSEILWVIGHRVSEAYRVSPETKRILEIRRIGENYGGENQCIDSGGRS
ncbi:tRNA lysidine(34) synthetase TilS [Marvinbryantia formatexigens DSM 14469]|nr:tRNA lysidine(34) synthetase TilS [Marvinbryantia formatexigens DSM 14469]